MHYSTCAAILAAGSSVASVSASGSGSMRDLFDIPSIARRDAAELTKRKIVMPLPKAADKTAVKPADKKPADKNAAANLVKGFAGSMAKGIVRGAGGVKNPNQAAGGGQKNTPGAGSSSSKPNTAYDPDREAMRRAAKQAAMYMDAYQEFHPPKKGQSLADDVPPPINFQMANNYGTTVTNTNTYQGGVTMNNNQQNAYGSSTIAAAGANVKVDKSMNDYRQQAAQGSTINGNNGGNRNSRRSTDDTYEVKEDGRVVYRDFVLLVKAMRRDPAAKEQVLYEIAGVPGFRPLVENLIQKYTNTNGELTMDNFAALVDSMTQDKAVETKVVDKFNSNLVFAAIMEKLLVKYYIPEDQGLSASASSSSSSSSHEKRDFDNEYFSFAIRSIEEDYIQMEAREFYDEYAWLASRGLDAESEELLARDLDAYLSYDPELFY